jgi:guanylate kinase
LGAVFIFLLPPSWKELERRLSGRKTESPEILRERLSQARSELAEARSYDYLVVNDELAKAEENLTAILRAEKCRTERRIEVLEAFG